MRYRVARPSARWCQARKVLELALNGLTLSPGWTSVEGAEPVAHGPLPPYPPAA